MSQEGYTVQTTKTTTQPQEKPKSWNKRVAEYIVNLSKEQENPLTVDFVEAMLEAAAELKAVKLKVMLARCEEIIYSAVDGGGAPSLDEDFWKDLLEANK